MGPALAGKVLGAAQQLRVKGEALPDQDGGEPGLPAQSTPGLRLPPSTVIGLHPFGLTATPPSWDPGGLLLRWPSRATAGRWGSWPRSSGPPRPGASSSPCCPRFRLLPGLFWPAWGLKTV